MLKGIKILSWVQIPYAVQNLNGTFSSTVRMPDCGSGDDGSMPTEGSRKKTASRLVQSGEL